MEKYQAFLSKYTKESYIKMIMGRTDGKTISEYFDNFAKQHNKQGGTEITKEINEFYKNNVLK